MNLKMYADLSYVVDKKSKKGDAFIEVKVPDNMRIKPSKGSSVRIWDDRYDVSYIGDVLEVGISPEGQNIASIMLDLSTVSTVDGVKPDSKHTKNNADTMSGFFGIIFGLLANLIFWFSPLGYALTIFSYVVNNTNTPSSNTLSDLLQRSNAESGLYAMATDILYFSVLLVLPLLGATLMRRHWVRNGNTSLIYHLGGVLNMLAAGISGFGFYIAFLSTFMLNGAADISSELDNSSAGSGGSFFILTLILGLFIIIPAFINFVIMYKVDKK